MTCKRCGKEVNEGAFCPYCGTPLYVELRKRLTNPMQDTQYSGSFFL